MGALVDDPYTGIQANASSIWALTLVHHQREIGAPLQVLRDLIRVLVIGNLISLSSRHSSH